MIPLSVRMTGWMRYRDEQVADFEHGRLISICGENGAGKSSIFDAITFALYGRHRLGKQGAAQLISQDMDRLSVEFEFAVGDARYIVRRSRTRTASGSDQSLRLADEAASDGWAFVPGTDKEDVLDRTLAGIVRLSAEAFTSSFLLQQGAATEFLDADPQPRFRIIAGLIGLAEYEALEKRARTARMAAKTVLDTLTLEIEKFGDVDEAAAARLRDEVAAATERDAVATLVLQAAQAMLADAERYGKRSAEVAVIDLRITSADALIAQKEEIEQDADRFKSFGDAIDKIQRIETTLADASREESAAKDALARAATIDLAALAAAHEAAQAASAQATKVEQDASSAQKAAEQAEREASDFAVIADAYTAARQAVTDCGERIAGYDARLAELPALEQEMRATAAMRDALPPLRALREALDHVEKLQAFDHAGTFKKLQEEAALLETTARASQGQIELAEKSHADALAESATARADAAHLTSQRAERTAATKESTCSRCGQPIDKLRAKAELAELAARLAQAKQRAAATEDAKREAAAAIAAVKKTHARTTATLAANATATAAASSGAQDAERAAASARQRRAEFEKIAPEELLVAAKGAKTGAAIAKLIGAHGDVPKRADAAAKGLAGLHAIAGQRTAAVTEQASHEKACIEHEARIGTRLDAVPRARAAHATAKQRLTIALDAAEQARAAAAAASTAVGSTSAALTAGGEQRTKLESDARLSAERASGHRKSAHAFTQGLGELAETALADPRGTLVVLRAQRKQLEGAPDRKLALDSAQHDRSAAAGERTAKQAEIDAIPAAHRVDAAIASAAATDAKGASGAANTALTAAHHELTTVEAQLTQVCRLRDERARADLRRKRLNKLVKLLGKEGLQGSLVATALDTIKNHANAFLQRLTGGSLQLTIKREGDAVELQAVDSTCMREPRSVKVLSGSQKFRCAVAIASGIGQFAGAGGMRSIVIDEGFGSLDEAGQALMVEELKQLATHMDKVIVVSHLDAFTDPANFPDRLIVETDGIGSRIRRAG